MREGCPVGGEGSRRPARRGREGRLAVARTLGLALGGWGAGGGGEARPDKPPFPPAFASRPGGPGRPLPAPGAVAPDGDHGCDGCGATSCEPCWRRILQWLTYCPGPCHGCCGACSCC